MANKKQQEVIDVNETLNKSEAFILKYKKTIIAAVVALIAIIAALFIYQNYINGPREDKASTALGRGQEYFSSTRHSTATEPTMQAS